MHMRCGWLMVVLLAIVLQGDLVASPVSAQVLPPRPFHHRGWKRVFADEFEGSRSGSCWRNAYACDVHTLEANQEAEWYAYPGDGTGFHATTVEHGKLVITAIPRPAGLALPAKLSYLSGMVMSDGCFSQTYGYFEIRAKIPAGKGLWPAFWLLPSSHKWPPEIDVFEMFGAANSRSEGGRGWIHTGTIPARDKTFTDWHRVPIDQYASFHRYGLLWGPDEMTVYVDGKAIASQHTPADERQPMYLIVNLAVGGRWPELPDAKTRFPARMYVDFVRAWQYDAWRKPEVTAQGTSAEKP